MRDQFRHYLLERLAPASINSYISGINHLSLNYGEEIFHITDLQRVFEINSLYGLSGEKRNIGEYGNGGARNGISKYYDFIRSISENEYESAVEYLPNVTENDNNNFSYERDLHRTLETQLAELFPEYQLISSEYLIEGVRIDILLEKNDELLVIELKSGKATYSVFGQISMYIGFLEQNFPNKSVKGVIIAHEIHNGLQIACNTNQNIKCMTYSMKLKLTNA